MRFECPYQARVQISRPPAKRPIASRLCTAVKPRRAAAPLLARNHIRPSQHGSPFKSIPSQYELKDIRIGERTGVAVVCASTTARTNGGASVFFCVSTAIVEAEMTVMRFGSLDDSCSRSGGSCSRSGCCKGLLVARGRSRKDSFGDRPAGRVKTAQPSSASPHPPFAQRASRLATNSTETSEVKSGAPVC